MSTAKEIAEKRWEEPSSPPASLGGSGGGDNFGERLATLEERVGHLATSKEVEQVKTEIAKAGAGIAKVDVGVRDMKEHINAKVDMGIRNTEERMKDHMKWILWILGILVTIWASSLFFLARMISFT